jgi:hypothetical protein
LPTIKVPDITKAPESDEDLSGSLDGLEAREYEVSASQAAKWNRLNEKEKLTLVLKADREHKEIREYL